MLKIINLQSYANLKYTHSHLHAEKELGSCEMT